MAAETKYYSEIITVQHSLVQALMHEITTASKPVLLLLSGGSCLNLCPLLTLANITVGMVDDRYDREHNSFLNLKHEYSTFYDQSIKQGVTFLDTSPHLADQYEMANWYEEKIKRHNGTTIVILGMGADGHIAGILPHPVEEAVFYERFLDTDKLVVGYDATGKNPFTKRFTLTYPALLKADRVFAYITGEEKKPALQKALHDNPPLHTCPAYYLATTPQTATIFTNISL